MHYEAPLLHFVLNLLALFMGERSEKLQDACLLYTLRGSVASTKALEKYGAGLCKAVTQQSKHDTAIRSVPSARSTVGREEGEGNITNVDV